MRAQRNCLVLALLSTALSITLFAADEFALGPVIAKGTGLEIRRSQLDDAFIAFRANLAARGQNIAEARREAAEAQLLDRIIVTQLLVNKATAADKESAQTNAVKFFQESRKMAESEADFARHLKSLGMTVAQFTNRVMEQAYSEAVITRVLKTPITISDDDIKKFYETNDAAFKNPDLARATHILFGTKDMKTGLPLSGDEKAAKKAKAEAVLQRARQGEDFTTLAEAFSEDPSAKENKGEYKFARAKDDPRRAMVPEFEAAAFSLKTNQISDLVLTDFGWHIIKLHELIPAKKTELTEVKEKIREHLTQRELEKQMPGFFAQVKKEANVEIVDEKLRAVMEKAEKERATK
ncbi:MAG TPA: peptidylprolyl isomerase [Methylomirabilota bacterium]|nr:peptidylprolyl isomerase [Methylomirabilota bacterium]